MIPSATVTFGTPQVGALGSRSWSDTAAWRFAARSATNVTEDLDRFLDLLERTAHSLRST